MGPQRTGAAHPALTVTLNRVNAARNGPSASSASQVSAAGRVMRPAWTARWALRVDLDVIVGGAHLNIDAGYGEWSAVLKWVRSGRVPLTPR